MPLGDALADPDDVARLLLLQLHDAVKDAVVELVLERQAVELDLQEGRAGREWGPSHAARRRR